MCNNDKDLKSVVLINFIPDSRAQKNRVVVFYHRWPALSSWMWRASCCLVITS